MNFPSKLNTEIWFVKIHTRSAMDFQDQDLWQLKEADKFSLDKADLIIWHLEKAKQEAQLYQELDHKIYNLEKNLAWLWPVA